MLAIAKPFDVILLDAFGVFWSGGETGFYPNAIDTIRALKKQGKKIAIISNSTVAAKKEADKYGKAGLVLDTDYDLIMTSGQLARDQIIGSGLPFPTARNTFYVFCGEHPKYGTPHKVMFEGSKYTEVSNVEDADFIYIGIPHINGEDQLDPAVFEAEVKKLVAYGRPAVCANPDEYAHEGKPPRPVVRQGSIAKLFEKFGGKVFYFGKPNPQVFDKVLEVLGVKDRSTVLMVGDTPRTDIRGANASGIKSVLITATGIASEEIFQSNMSVEKYIQSLPPSDRPTYTFEKFITGNLSLQSKL